MSYRWMLFLFAITSPLVIADTKTPSVPPQVVTVSAEAIPLDAVSASVTNITANKGAASQSYNVEGFLGNFGSHQLRAGGQPVWKSVVTSISASYFGIGEQVEKDSSSLGTIALTSNVGMQRAGNLYFTF